MKNKFEPTKEQKQARDIDKNLIVSAGAGSGKTTVMIERIIGKLKAGDKIDDMLIVTFTRASAADLKCKLTEKLHDLKAEPSYAHIAAQALEALPVADIGTLHSFCQRLIKTYFYVAEIDPSAVICEDGEASLYKAEAVNSAVDECVRAAEQGSPLKKLYLAMTAQRGKSEFADAVSKTMEFALSMSDPDRYLTEQKSDAERVCELDKIMDKRRTELICKAQKVVESAHSVRADKLEAAACDIIACLNGEISFAEITATKVGQSAPSGWQSVNGSLKEVKDACKKFCVEIEEVNDAEKLESAEYSAAVRFTARVALKKYSERKKNLCKIDYADLEHGAQRVLANENCRAELKDKIKFVFIDEFQDVNPLQAHIADSLASLGGVQMFFVGDVKQSIYGFRRCSPEHFADKVDAAESNEIDFVHIALNNNFRSLPCVIDFVNHTFDGLMTEDFGGVDYCKERLIKREFSDAEMAKWANDFTAELITVEKEKAEKTDGEMRAYSVKDAGESDDYCEESKLVAKCILDYLKYNRKLLEEQKSKDNGHGGETADDGDEKWKYRSYSSIAVLVRSLQTTFCADLKKLLQIYSVPARFGKSPKMRDCPEAVALVDILRCVDNRYDDLALYTALRSPMGGFDDAELLRIAKTGESLAIARNVTPAKDGDFKAYAFWQKAEAFIAYGKVEADENHKNLSDRLNDFYALRSGLADFAKNHDAADVLGEITAKTAYFQYVYDRFGSDAAERVDALIRVAARRGDDTHAFIKYCDETSFELSGDGGSDAVSVMTMHGSKGLEFDYVIVADTGHSFNYTDAYKKIIVSDGGVAVKIPDDERHRLVPSVSWLIERKRMPEEVKKEELRLFYVALTRAKKKLTVCGTPSSRTLKNSMLGFLMEKTSHVAIEHTVLEKPSGGPRDLPSEKVESAVAEICGFKYANKSSVIKKSVTALSIGDEIDDAFVPVMTDDETGECGLTLVEGTDAQTTGTLYHKAMEIVDFDNPDYAAINRTRGLENIDTRVVERAVNAVKTLAAGAAHIFKERYFIADLGDCAEEESAVAAKPNLLVQGVIDLLILDGKGGAVIVDYKTTKPQRLFIEGYKRQLTLYARAVEKTTRGALKVKGAYLYSFVTGKLYKAEI